MKMTPLPGAMAPKDAAVAWRIDASRYAATWDSSIGAESYGARWNPAGLRVVYCGLDPSTSLLESAVHRGFDVLDVGPFTLTRMTIMQASAVKVIQPCEVPNPGWLHAGTVSAGQQAWGEALLAEHAFVVFPSVVSKPSWSLAFRPDKAKGLYCLDAQTPLVVDGRLNRPPVPPSSEADKRALHTLRAA